MYVCVYIYVYIYIIYRRFRKDIEIFVGKNYAHFELLWL